MACALSTCRRRRVSSWTTERLTTSEKLPMGPSSPRRWLNSAFSSSICCSTWTKGCSCRNMLKELVAKIPTDAAGNP
eukprot:6033494-Prymnesium_polylepis.1